MPKASEALAENSVGPLYRALGAGVITVTVGAVLSTVKLSDDESAVAPAASVTRTPTRWTTFVSPAVFHCSM
jgi:hypothetical protein